MKKSFIMGFSLVLQRNVTVKVLNSYKEIKKEGAAVVELDQIKYILSTYDKPLVELRDSL